MGRPAEDNAEASRIMLGLLDAVEQDRAHSQRHLASELGIALGLVNAYLKRCMNKGLVKVRQAPARRYAYYLTPQGFTEKSRLTVEYLSSSFSFFRQAKTDCTEMFRLAKSRDLRSFVLIGKSDLAEIAALCAIEQGIGIAGLVDNEAQGAFVGTPIFRALGDINGGFDAALITDVRNAQAAAEAAIGELGIERVIIPKILRVRIRHDSGAAE